MANEFFNKVKSKTTGTTYDVQDSRVDALLESASSAAALITSIVKVEYARINASHIAEGVLKLAKFDTTNKTIMIKNTSDAEVSLIGLTLKAVDEEGAARISFVFTSEACATSVPASGSVLVKVSTKDIKDADGNALYAENTAENPFASFYGPSYGLSGKKAWGFSLVNACGEVIDAVSQTTGAKATDGKVYVAETQTWEDAGEDTVFTTEAPEATTAEPAA